ncbi:hypothetical protein ARMGADRAFT_1141133 [Armillaria gallica]|uniref:Uncharacterized protein n=1 Tax=Armillaria gallica TaxID=47427 RepID=A0A2H3CKD7_ARMGA|nr:hypothetical protein ARMGADRAFT_1141133 [Armillaria gallica]
MLWRVKDGRDKKVVLYKWCYDRVTRASAKSLRHVRNRMHGKFIQCGTQTKVAPQVGAHLQGRVKLPKQRHSLIYLNSVANLWNGIMEVEDHGKAHDSIGVGVDRNETFWVRNLANHMRMDTKSTGRLANRGAVLQLINELGISEIQFTEYIIINFRVHNASWGLQSTRWTRE